MKNHPINSPFQNSWWMKGVLLALFALLLLFGFKSVSAHGVEPTKTEPADGTALAQSPEKVTVWFPEEAVAEKSTLKVFDAQGKQVDLGGGGVDLTDASHQVMVVSLPTLEEGVYTVRWSISLEDGDSAEGSFNFGVGNVTVPTTAPEPTEAAAVDQSAILWFVGGAVVLVVLFVFQVYRRRGSS